MQTLSYGYKKPDSGDKGPVVFPAMESNIDQINAHNHNGTNSEKLTSAAVNQVTQTLLAAAWVLVGNGIYKQTVTTPPSIDYDVRTPQFKLSTGEVVYLGTVRLSSTSFEVYINDNTVNVVVQY